MNKKSIVKAKIIDILKENLRNQNTYFVFPSQTAADMWADRVTIDTEIKAVASERFMAWDQFKEQSIHSKDPSKTSIPSTMREIFTAQILSENAEKPFLTYLITEKYSGIYSSFVSHISALLPSLALWKKKFDEAKIEPDAEDRDLLEIYRRYKEYLDKHNCFDPAWETPPFTKDGNKYFIFYPEVYSDYAEYQILLEDAEDIQIINIPDLNTEDTSLLFYSNSRTEIRKASQEILKAHKEGIPWFDIAVSVPDIDTYAPYLKRDFDLYQIPYVMRSAKPLSKTTAGRFFSDAEACVRGNFNFDSIKNLLLNSDLPWKGTKEIQALIDFGKENHCVYNFEYNNKEIDVWEKSLKDSGSNELINMRYKLLKKDLKKLVNSKDFKEIRKHYFEFREDFFDMAGCTIKTDNILSRCISELSGLIDLEEKYNDCTVRQCYSFYVNFLGEKKYLEQNALPGVQILPYKLAAASPFLCQIIVDASQKGTSVIYRQLGFLSETKRIQICGKKNAENNVSDLFIKLYAMHSLPGKTIFSGAGKTFSGYAQAASGLKLEDYTRVEDEEVIFENDFYHDEKKWITDENPLPEKLFRNQKTFLENWIRCNRELSESMNIFSCGEEIFRKLIKQRQYSDKYLKVSARGDLEKFFNCPREWFLNNLLHAEEINNDAEIMDPYTIGKLNHKILELYCLELKRNNLPLDVIQRKDGDKDVFILDDKREAILKASIKTALEDKENCFMYRELFESARAAIEANAFNSVTHLSKYFKNFLIDETEYAVSYIDEEKQIYLNGRIDLILKNQLKDEYIVIDYKTGKVPAVTSSKKLLELKEKEQELPLTYRTRIDFQMAMYIYLLSKEEKPKNVTAAGFYSLSANEVGPVFGTELNVLCGLDIKNKGKNRISDERDEFEGHINLLKEYISFFKEKVDTRDFSIDDKVQTFTVCAECNYSAYCRRAFTTGKAE